MHALCCIENDIKDCLLQVTKSKVVCDQNYCWCPEDITKSQCGINFFITGETVLDSSRTIGGRYRCGLGTLDIQFFFDIEIYAIACEDARFKSKECLAKINELLCIHNTSLRIGFLQYEGFQTRSATMGEEQLSVMVASYSARYLHDQCEPEKILISCK